MNMRPRENAMLDALDRQTRMTGNQKKILAAGAAA
jgi:hypothetical protein